MLAHVPNRLRDTAMSTDSVLLWHFRIFGQQIINRQLMRVKQSSYLALGQIFQIDSSKLLEKGSDVLHQRLQLSPARSLEKCLFRIHVRCQ